MTANFPPALTLLCSIIPERQRELYEWRAAHDAEVSAHATVAATRRIRALHSDAHWCIGGDGRPDLFSPDAPGPWPCRELPLLDELDAAVRGER